MMTRSKWESNSEVGNSTNEGKRTLIDYISGIEVLATPEEAEAVQVFAKKLVEDYGYRKHQIQTHPQFRTKTAPSGEEKYPVDIAVFYNDKKEYNNMRIVVECKQPNRSDGLKQLSIYLNLIPSVEIGVWFNGKDHLYLRKAFDDGRITWKEIPDIPKHGERVADIGLYKRKDLQTPNNLKVVFNDIRNHLAGSATGITRDEAIAQQIINILFCKLYDEINTAPDENVKFRAGIDEDKIDVRTRIENLFTKVKQDYDDVFDEEDSIKLDDDSLIYVVGELQKYCIISAERDALGDAFEVFIGPALRGGEGQFFTPRNVVKMVVRILDPDPGEYVIDPACGSGGFLIVALEYVWDKIEEEGKRKNWSQELIVQKKKDISNKYFFGIDKDSFLAKVTKAYMAIIGDGRGGVFCENSLFSPLDWQNKTQDRINFGSFDVLLTNPPFGSKISITSKEVLSQYSLSYKWRFNKNEQKWERTQKFADRRPPQILFIERCLELLKPGGRIGIVLPDSIVGNQSDGYIREFILSRANLLAVVDLPNETFQPSTSTKTSVVFLQKKDQVMETDYKIFMAFAEKCGHDRRAKPIFKKDEHGELIPDDDLPLIAEEYQSFKRRNY